MPFVVALLIWFALSIPAALILGRSMAAASGRRAAVPVRRIHSTAQGLVRS